MWNICDHWQAIGKNLGLRQYEISTLTHLQPRESMKRVLNYWADKKHEPYTWETFINALRAIKQTDMADFVKGMLYLCIKINLCFYTIESISLPSGDQISTPEPVKCTVW